MRGVNPHRLPSRSRERTPTRSASPFNHAAWVVERFFAWIGRNRRLVKDFEARFQTLLGEAGHRSAIMRLSGGRRHDRVDKTSAWRCRSLCVMHHVHELAFAADDNSVESIQGRVSTKLCPPAGSQARSAYRRYSDSRLPTLSSHATVTITYAGARRNHRRPHRLAALANLGDHVPDHRRWGTSSGV
jgi:hypothetical protein